MAEYTIKEKKEALFDAISNCRKCNQRYGREPFHFPLGDQKVMLITANPSIQAMHRPLTSIRFFRHICVALFGEKGISTSAIDALHRLIYWTHMHKCCYYRSWKSENYLDLPKICRESFLEDEIELMQPGVIIGLGVPVAHALFQDDLKKKPFKLGNYSGESKFAILENRCVKLKKWDADVYLTDFPGNGREDRFDMIRSCLSNLAGFDFMRPETTGIWFPNEIDYSHRNLKGLNVNIDFEVKSLEYSLEPNSAAVSYSQATANEVWLRKVVTGNLRNYDKATAIISYLEDIIRALMVDIFNDNTY